MNERIDDLIALAVLGELTADESRELDEAVRSDPEVAAELADARSAAAAVQSTVAEDPPPRLKASVMDAIAALPQQPPVDAVAGDAVDDVVDDAVDDVGAGAVPPVTVRAIGSARSQRRIVPWLAAVAAAVVLVVGAVMLSGGDDADVGDEIAAVVQADDAVVHSLAGEIGEMKVVYSPRQGALVFTGDGIEALPEGSTYQAWLVADGAPASVGTFAPDPDGQIAFRADGFDPSGAVVAVTVEPEGGSEQPTMPIVAQTS